MDLISRDVIGFYSSHAGSLELKRLRMKELPSRPDGQSLHGLDVLCLPKLNTAGTTADKKRKERKS